MTNQYLMTNDQKEISQMLNLKNLKFDTFSLKNQGRQP